MRTQHAFQKLFSTNELITPRVYNARANRKLLATLELLICLVSSWPRWRHLPDASCHLKYTSLCIVHLVMWNHDGWKVDERKIRTTEEWVQVVR